MSRKKVLTAVLSVAAVCGLTLALVLLSTPAPAASHAGYTWKPGCHCGKPTTTTVKKTTTTIKKTTTTVKKTTTTVKRTTTTVKKQTTTTTVAPTTTSSETTTTTLAGPGETVLDLTYLWGAPDTKENMDFARGIVAGLALSGGIQPPSDSGPSGGSSRNGDGGAGGVIATDDAAASDSGPVPSDGAEVQEAAAAAETSGMEFAPPRYYVSPVAIVFLLVYAISFVLYKTKSIRVTTHRKIWNVLLLATFLVTGMFGLILAIGISVDPPWLLPRSLLFWHVETGVVMSFISFFHLGWHLRYYLAVLTRRSRAHKEPALESVPARVYATEGPAG
jgi:hypothetical protein